MTCAACRTWCATDEAQLATRIMNINGSPDIRANPCPACGGTDWVSSREMIEEATVMKLRDKVVLFFGTPLSWRVIIFLNLAAAALFAFMMFLAEQRWLVMLDAGMCGFNLSQALSAKGMGVMSKLLAESRDLFNAMVQLNNQLIQAKVEAVIFRDGDGPPIAPETRH